MPLHWAADDLDSMKTETQRFWLTLDAEAAKRALIWAMSKRFPVVFNLCDSRISASVALLGIELKGVRKTLQRAVRWLERRRVAVSPVELDVIEG